MELSIAIIGLVLILMFIIPTVILSIKSKDSTKAKFEQLNSFFVNGELRKSEYEFWGDYSIGIDSASGKVVYIMKGKDNNHVEVIDLRKVKKCSINNLLRSVESKSGSELVNDLVGLKFVFNDTELKDLNLEFFNSEKKGYLDNELGIAKKWAEIIYTNINKCHTVPKYKKVG
jgi:hypothetical protein